MRRVTVRGLIAASSIGTVVMVASAQQAGGRADFWPRIHGNPVVKEWYSDIPWHQKLGTFAGNEIDEALILPYGALPAAEQKYCKDKGMSDDDCMIEFGVNNVLGMLRTDTPYDPTDEKIQKAAECKDPSLPCIEVALELSSFWSRVGGSGIELRPRPFGKEPADFDNLSPSMRDLYGGYVITDGSTYAPQMPWYMAHYCQSGFRPDIDMQDPVCYADYFSPMNVGFNTLPAVDFRQWPKSSPWSVFPFASPPGPTNHCKDGLTDGTSRCTMAMAAFDLKEVPSNPGTLQYARYNDNLMKWFNNALGSFKSESNKAERERHFPWSGTPVTWEKFLYPQAALNPFLGTFDDVKTADPVTSEKCNDIALDGPPVGIACTQTTQYRAKGWLYPRQCELGDLAGNDIERLRKCSLNYELHHNGYLEQWPQSYWQDLANADMRANQYGRTSFLFAGVPGMQQPVSFLKVPGSNLTIYEQVYNASIFSLYLPIANVADNKVGFPGRLYSDVEFYHTLLMSNHMEADPYLFAEGIRGKTLWHNEYRTQKMYQADRDGKSTKFPAVTFAASFDADKAPAPFHNNTCDGCHVRNGSGVPINASGMLDKGLTREFMKPAAYDARVAKDYTFTGVIRPMKLVFFDLQRDTTRLDSSRYSEPLAFHPTVAAKPPRSVQAEDLYYDNKIMNFYGDSFHVKAPNSTYEWTYVKASPDRMVVGATRFNAELKKAYEPWQVQVSSFTVKGPCQIVKPAPTPKPWPSDCKDVDGGAILDAVNGTPTVRPAVGYLLLNGKRLGNLSAIEAMPNQAIIDIRDSQKALLGESIAGEIIWNAGSRDGVGGKVHKDCRTKGLVDCYIGRFGWIGDRASLEDQVANAAFVEMNMTTTEGYNRLYGADKVLFPLRYAHPNCGPANKTCIESKGNADLTETDVNRMADYARWVGNPTRSDFQVALDEVVAGEAIFRRVKCDTCHVIARIDIVPEDTMVTKPYRDRLATRVSQLRANRPFLSYIGTDLLMHDMGYLSQVGDARQPVRDSDGVVLPQFKNYVQKIRTPALKGLQFNRFVTESYRNTVKDTDPACDFLLHDGRACDAIEAAFLHDGPAIKKLGVIDALNRLSESELVHLRAFLYSL